MTLRTLRRAVVTLAGALCVTSLFAAAPSMAAPDQPGFHRPSVGTCTALTMKQLGAKSNTQKPVRCARTHTARVIAAPTVPTRIGWNQQAKLEQFAANACQPALNKALGKTAKLRAMSAYHWGWFVPTADERSHGARWIRCDLVLIAGNRLAPLPTPALSTPMRDKVRQCVTRSGMTTTCTSKHLYRSANTFLMRHRGYPTHQQFINAASKRCPSLVGRSRTFGWATWAGAATWKAGQHLVVCYAKTRR